MRRHRKRRTAQNITARRGHGHNRPTAIRQNGPSRHVETLGREASRRSLRVARTKPNYAVTYRHDQPATRQGRNRFNKGKPRLLVPLPTQLYVSRMPRKRPRGLGRQSPGNTSSECHCNGGRTRRPHSQGYPSCALLAYALLGPRDTVRDGTKAHASKLRQANANANLCDEVPECTAATGNGRTRRNAGWLQRPNRALCRSDAAILEVGEAARTARQRILGNLAGAKFQHSKKEVRNHAEFASARPP